MTIIAIKLSKIRDVRLTFYITYVFCRLKQKNTLSDKTKKFPDVSVKHF